MRGTKVVIEGTPEEIAALVRATQERQSRESFVGVDVMVKAIRESIINFSNDTNRLAEILRPKDDTEPEAPELPSS